MFMNNFIKEQPYFVCQWNAAFALKFENGYTVDVGFTSLHHCNNYHADRDINPQHYGTIYGCNNGEVAVLDPNHNLVTNKILRHMERFDWINGDDVLDYATPNQMAEIIAYVSKLKGE